MRREIGRGEKKTEKLKNRENRKKITEKPNREKKPIKLIKILKKPADSVRFRFYKPKTEKTERNRTQTEKTELNRQKTEPNRFELVFVLKNQTKPKQVSLNLFRFGFNFFF